MTAQSKCYTVALQQKRLGKLTQAKGRLAQLELIVVMAAVFGAVSGGRGRLPHQQVVVDPAGERREKRIHVNPDKKMQVRHRDQNQGQHSINKECLALDLIVNSNNISSCSAATPVIDALEGLFAGQQYIGQWEADIHGALTLSHALLLELFHLLRVSWDHHLRHQEEHRGIWSPTIPTGC